MLQATSSRSALDSVRGGAKSLERRIARHAEMERAAAAEKNPHLKRSLEIDAEAEGEEIRRQRAILDRLRRRAGQQ